jgi:hypothetical protein
VNPEDKIKELIGKSDIATDAQTENRILGDALNHLDILKQKTPRIGLYIWRIIMKSPIVKLAAAAVIIMAITLGLFEFTGTESTSGVVWAEVVRKVGASRGLIVRCKYLDPSHEDDYSIIYHSPRHCRTDFYKDEQITRTCYTDFTNSDTDTFIDVYHIKKFCLTTLFKKAGLNEAFPEQHEGAVNPELLVQTILSGEHRKLAQKTIEGVLCEGIETTDLSCIGPTFEKYDRLDVGLQLWVSVETGYPVLFERKMSGEYEGQVWEYKSVMDQFQWDVELDSSIFEPNVPTDYERVTRPGIVGQ